MASFLLLFSTTEAMASSILVRQGSRGPAVRQVQSLLIEQGWLTGAADGICGNQTVAAIKSFQKANGLDADGVCGNGTYSVLSGGREYEPSSDESEGTVMYVNATAYSADDPGNSAYTALGTHVRHGIIAVDPDIIPLGTHVYIPGYGDAVAEDVGGAIHGHRRGFRHAGGGTGLRPPGHRDLHTRLRFREERSFGCVLFVYRKTVNHTFLV